jgi:hypothetical protein
MDGKVIKRLTMLSLISMLTLCAAAASVHAQLSNPVRATIPFEFNVGERKLPAGEYTFSRLSGFADNKLMSVSNVEAHANVFQLILDAHVLTPKNRTTLVFHKYFDQYFLEQIWLDGEREGTQAPESRSERAIERQLAQTPQSNTSGKVFRAETVDIVAALF